MTDSPYSHLVPAEFFASFFPRGGENQAEQLRILTSRWGIAAFALSFFCHAHSAQILEFSLWVAANASEGRFAAEMGRKKSAGKDRSPRRMFIGY